MISKFKKKPVVIEAIRWSGNEKQIPEILDWAKDYLHTIPEDSGYIVPGMGYVPALGTLDIPTLEGVMTAQPGDYIIKGVKGEFYPCKPDIFEATYEKTWE